MKKCWHGEVAGKFWRSSFGIFYHVIEYLCERDVLKKCWHGGAGRPVLKVEFWYVFKHVIIYLCEKDVFKKCWHGRLAGQFWRLSFCMFLST